MAHTFTEELVFVETEDGAVLEGAVIRPASQEPRPLAIVWVHGLTGKFYSPMIVTIGRQLAGQGFVFVTGNNRGHDFGTLVRRRGQPMLAGGGWELFEESPFDVAAWTGYAAGLVVRGVVLLGHSLGALKVAYYQAQRQDPRVAGLIAASPPTRAGRLQPELVAQAERMVAEGRGRDLLPWGVSPAGAGTVSAQTYLSRARVNIDVYGFHTPDPAVARIRCPILAFYGTSEEWVGTPADLETIRQNARAAARVDTCVFEGADHVYTGCEDRVAAAVADWVAGLG